VETSTNRQVAELADDILCQLEDGYAPHRRGWQTCADGATREFYRVFYADVCGFPAVARIVLDLDPARPRRPVHEVRILADGPMPELFAAALADAIREGLDATADYAR
jgi:hypothetical protein